MGGVSPIDMQVMITKSVEVAKQYGQDMHKGIKSQQDLAEEEKRLQEENTRKVHDRNKVERIYTTEDEDEGTKNNKYEPEQKDNENSDKSDDENKDEVKSYDGVMGHFDIKI
jgi:hypothetical protein